MPQISTHTELLLFIIDDDNKHTFFIDPTQLHIRYFENISFVPNFLVEHSETSDIRPFISSDTTIENPYYSYDTTQTEEIETIHDKQDTFHDTHQIVNELLKDHYFQEQL